MVKQKYNEETLINYLLEASEALNASIKLLDKKFGTIQWRQDWTETAEKINNFLSSIRVDN
jgi:hypothetical protein